MQSIIIIGMMKVDFMPEECIGISGLTVVNKSCIIIGNRIFGKGSTDVDHAYGHYKIVLPKLFGLLMIAFLSMKQYCNSQDF